MMCNLKKDILNILLKSFEEKVKRILTEKYFNIYQYRDILEISGILTTTTK